MEWIFSDAWMEWLVVKISVCIGGFTVQGGGEVTIRLEMNINIQKVDVSGGNVSSEFDGAMLWIQVM